MLPWPPWPRHSKGEVCGSTRPAPDGRSPYRPAEAADAFIITAATSSRWLARTAREVEAAALRGRVTPAVRTKFQAVALLLRDERARVRAAAGSDSRRAEQLKRLDGIATILATTAVQDAGLLALLAEDSGVSDAGPVAQAGNAAGPRHRASARRDRAGGDRYASAGSERRVVPQSG